MIQASRRSILALGIATVLLQACVPTVQVPPGVPDDAAVIAPNILYKVPPPGALQGSITVQQLIVARFRGQSFSFEAQIAITPQQLDLVALDGLGRRALTIGWNGHDLHYEPAPWLPPIFRPADILTSMSIAYWPEDAVRAALAGTKATVTTSATQRVIALNGKPLVVVDYGQGDGWSRPAHVRNAVFGFELDIQSAELAN
jgi:uncharacterized protein DUF3261